MLCRSHYILYYLSDMSEPDQGNLTLVPGSHKALVDPDAQAMQDQTLFDGALQVCGGPGTAVIFHNAVWHTAGPFSRDGGKRVMLYYGYEHPWMLACAEQWRYDKAFLRGLSEAQRRFFHGLFLIRPNTAGDRDERTRDDEDRLEHARPRRQSPSGHGPVSGFIGHAFWFERCGFRLFAAD